MIEKRVKDLPVSLRSADGGFAMEAAEAHKAAGNAILAAGGERAHEVQD